MTASERTVAVPNSTGTASPASQAPAHAADCHIHIYDPRFAPPVESVSQSTIADYRLLQQRIGVSRVVIVTPRNYVTDNRVTLDAIRQLGIANARGVGVIHPTVTDAELEHLHDGGIRGIRFTVGKPHTAVVTIDMIEPLAKRIAPLGWHIQLNMEAQQIAEHAELLRRVPTAIVFDHLGKLLPPAGLSHPATHVIRELLDQGRAWVKLSGAYMVSKLGPPAYAEASEVARAFVNAAPERLVWGSDWPHPSAKPKPDDSLLFDLLADWAPDDATRQRILVTNPEVLYGFPPAV